MLQIMDVIFFIFVPNSWLTTQENNWVWNNQQGLHVFAIIIAVVLFIMKVKTVKFSSLFYICCTSTKKYTVDNDIENALFLEYLDIHHGSSLLFSSFCSCFSSFCVSSFFSVFSMLNSVFGCSV